MNNLIDIPEYEGYYKINKMGDIYSVKRDINLKLYQDKDGYLVVSLNKNNKNKTMKVHRLVMLAFVGPSQLEVNHKDGTKSNNRLENLEYVTSSQNSIHAYRTKLKSSLKGESHGRAKLTEKEVIEIRNLRKKGMTLKNISNLYEISISVVNKVCLKKLWRHI